jgi:hypothetical protein
MAQLEKEYGSPNAVDDPYEAFQVRAHPHCVGAWATLGWDMQGCGADSDTVACRSLCV